MELLYVWIEDYKNIKKQGFNFSPKHWFEYDKKTNTIRHEDGNPNYPKDFFGENISNVTAIAGKNGSGKSSLVSRILNSIQSPIETMGRYFLIIKNNSNEIKIHNVGIDLETELPALFEDYLANPKWSQTNTNLIYYSNDLLYGPPIIKDEKFGFSSDTTNIIDKDVFDISTNTLLQKNVTIGKFKSEALLNICNFLKDYQAISNKVQLPEYFVADLPYPNFDQLRIKEMIKNLVTKERLEKQSPMFTTEKYIAKWENFCTDLEVWIHSNYTEEYFVTQIHYQLFFAFVENHYQRLDDKLDILADCFQATNLNFESIPKKFFNHLRSDRENYKVVFTKRVDATIRFMEFLEDVFSNNKLRAIKDDEDGTYRCHFNIKDKNDYKLLFEFIEHLNEVKWPESHTEDKCDRFNLFDFYFEFNLTQPSNFSTGEISMLHFFARLYHLKKNNTGKEIKNNTILLIDEGDLGYHPEWQREFLKLVISEVSNIFKEHKVQIILTTHSPFLISDLPKENIIFLNKDKNGLCRVEPPEDITHTFGANIHSLYRNSFFLENGLMGEFAKGKIDDVIKDLDLSKKDIPEDRQKAMQFIIEQIGEPLIKRKLKQMYDDKFHSPEQIDNRIKALEEEIKKLKGRQS